MKPSTPPLESLAQLDSMAAHANQLLKFLLTPGQHSADMIQWLLEIRRLVDCWPLTSSEYAVARRRIENAIRFLDSREYGAAKFEIRQLKGGLKHYRTLHSVYHSQRHSQRSQMPNAKHWNTSPLSR